MQVFKILLLLSFLFPQLYAAQKTYADSYEKSVDLGSILFSHDRSDTHYVPSVIEAAQKIKKLSTKYQKSHVLLTEDISCKENKETFSSKIEDVMIDEGVDPKSISMYYFRQRIKSFTCKESHEVKIMLYLDGLIKKKNTTKKSTTEVILLDGHKKNTAVVLSTATGAVVLNKVMQAATMSESVISAPKIITQEELANSSGKILNASNREQYTFVLYFDKKLQLETKSKEELKKIVVLLESLHYPYINIVGHTDTRGSVSDNYELALQRATEIAQKIKSSGVNYVKMDVSSNSELDLAVQTEDETEEVLNRRVEILIQ